MNAVLVTPPAVEPLSVAEVQAHLRLDTQDDNAWLQGAIRTARQRCENVTGRTLVTQTWDLYADKWPGYGTIELVRYLSPVQSVTEVAYTPENGSELVFASSNYVVDTYSVPARIVLRGNAAWPGAVLEPVNGVRVRVVCGYGADGLSVPAELRAGMLLMIGDLYEYRESNYPAGMVVPTNDRVDDLFRMHETRVY